MDVNEVMDGEPPVTVTLMVNVAKLSVAIIVPEALILPVIVPVLTVAVKPGGAVKLDNVES